MKRLRECKDELVQLEQKRKLLLAEIQSVRIEQLAEEKRNIQREQARFIHNAQIHYIPALRIDYTPAPNADFPLQLLLGWEDVGPLVMLSLGPMELYVLSRVSHEMTSIVKKYFMGNIRAILLSYLVGPPPSVLIRDNDTTLVVTLVTNQKTDGTLTIGQLLSLAHKYFSRHRRYTLDRSQKCTNDAKIRRGTTFLYNTETGACRPLTEMNLYTTHRYTSALSLFEERIRDDVPMLLEPPTPKKRRIDKKKREVDRQFLQCFDYDELSHLHLNSLPNTHASYEYLHNIVVMTQTDKFSDARLEWLNDRHVVYTLKCNPNSVGLCDLYELRLAVTNLPADYISYNIEKEAHRLALLHQFNKK